MTKQTEAMKLALEALEESLGYVEEEAENAQRLYGQYPTRQARIQGLKDDVRKHMNAITAIREALAEQPAQRCWKCGDMDVAFQMKCTVPACGMKEQPAQPQQEPMAWMQNTTAGLYVIDHCDEWHCIPLYTTPPQRKPLTDEEIEKVWRRVQANDFHDCVQPFARAIEAKLKEKNT